jgi:hypothetical protein
MIVVRILPIWRIHLWWVTYPGTSRAIERSLCNIELKSGTLVITCSAVSEILKKSIYEYYDHSSTKTFCLHTKSNKPDNESMAGKMLIIEESLFWTFGRESWQVSLILLFSLL